MSLVAVLLLYWGKSWPHPTPFWQMSQILVFFFCTRPLIKYKGHCLNLLQYSHAEYAYREILFFQHKIHMDLNLSRKLHTIVRVRVWSFTCYLKVIKLCIFIVHYAHFILQKDIVCWWKVWPAEWYYVFGTWKWKCEF